MKLDPNQVSETITEKNKRQLLLHFNNLIMKSILIKILFSDCRFRGTVCEKKCQDVQCDVQIQIQIQIQIKLKNLDIIIKLLLDKCSSRDQVCINFYSVPASLLDVVQGFIGLDQQSICLFV